MAVEGVFWGLAGPGAPSSGDPGRALRSQRSLPGPAGRVATVRPAASTVSGASVGGGGSRGGGGGQGFDPDFLSKPWLQALQEADCSVFDEQREPFKDNTVRVASGLQRNGGLRSLLALVLTVRRCHSGEAFVRLKDPTGTIGATVTRATLAAEPDIRQGAVLRLRRVTVLRTPPPRSLNHLCITLDSLVQVIPPADASAAPAEAPAGARPALGAPALAFPALPAPPPRALPPAASWQPARQQQQQQQQPLPQQSAGGRVMPPPPARPPAAAPASSTAWPSLGTAPAGHPLQQQQQQQQQQQHMAAPQRAASSTFAWPSLGPLGVGGAPRPGMSAQQQQQQPLAPPPHARPLAGLGGSVPFGGRQQQQQPEESASINFSMPAFSQSQQQDDATSGPRQAAGTQRQQQQAAVSPNDWLQGLLAEAAASNPFAASQGCSQQPAPAARQALAERQPWTAAAQQQSPPGPPTAKRQCGTSTSPPLSAVRAQQQLGQQQRSPPLSAAAGFGDVDELDLEDA